MMKWQHICDRSTISAISAYSCIAHFYCEAYIILKPAMTAEYAISDILPSGCFIVLQFLNICNIWSDHYPSRKFWNSSSVPFVHKCSFYSSLWWTNRTTYFAAIIKRRHAALSQNNLQAPRTSRSIFMHHIELWNFETREELMGRGIITSLVSKFYNSMWCIKMDLDVRGACRLFWLSAACRLLIIAAKYSDLSRPLSCLQFEDVVLNL